MVDISYANYRRLHRVAKRPDELCSQEVWEDLVSEEERRNVITALAKQAQVEPGKILDDRPRTGGVDAW